jgi:integrase
MITLPNNCYCYDIKVLPKNWKTSKAAIHEEWMVYYRFYDPSFKHDPKYKKGKLIRIKSMNAFKDVLQRQEQTDKIIHAELKKLKDEAYNPITGLYATGQALSNSIKESTPFFQALTAVEKLLTSSKSTKRDLRSVLKAISTASTQIGIYNNPIGVISRKHIKMLLTQIELNNGEESIHRYNKNRTYLMMLFKELVEIEAVETNPVREISKKQRVIPVRQLLTIKERKRIDSHLKNNYPRFWLFTHIFFHSGARLTEMMQVKRSDVNIPKQEFIVTVKKGKVIRRVVKPIKDIALPFWEKAVVAASDNEYIFSVNLCPGSKAINTDQITKRWKNHVKDKLDITADFYSLKHLHLDEIANNLTIEDAAAMASHTSTQITLKHYAVNERQRQNERLKALTNAFV